MPRSARLAVQVPGFTHPVKDCYLEDVLALLDAPGPAAGERAGGRGRGRGGRGRGGGARGARGAPADGGGSIGAERRAAVEAAILQAFVGGTDADFDHLLEARALNPLL